MEVKLHKLARTTPSLREEIRHSPLPSAELSRMYGISLSTVYKWRKREVFYDLPHTRHNLLSSLGSTEEELVKCLRLHLELSLDDITEVMRRCVNPRLSRSAIHRCLQRRGLGKRLHSSKPKASSGTFETVAAPGFIHMDVKHLTRLEGRRSYVYVAIDRATRYVYTEVLYDLKPATAAGFVERFVECFPHAVNVILTDNGMEWTDRCSHSVKRKATGKHAVDTVCKRLNIQHRLTKPYHPQTNGMVERFNRRLNEATAKLPKSMKNSGKNTFTSHQNRNSFIQQFVDNYNNTRLTCLKYNSPKSLLYDHTGCNTEAGITAAPYILIMAASTVASL